MILKIKRILPILLLSAVLLSACSKSENSPDVSGTAATIYTSYEEAAETDFTTLSAASNEDTDDYMEIWSIEGYYMRSSGGDMLIWEESDGYNSAAIIYFEGEEHGEIPMDSLKTGDRIEIDLKLIMETYPSLIPLYGLRLLESGDISDIDDSMLLNLESMGYHAVIGENTEEPLITRHSGYFVRTDTDCFLVPSEQYGMLSEIDILKINPAPFVEEISLDGFNTGDRLWVDIMLIQELYPPVAPIYGTALIENGNISDIDGDVVSRLTELGYTISEEN